jgi:hypothetical protein
VAQLTVLGSDMDAVEKEQEEILDPIAALLLVLGYFLHFYRD